MGGEALQQLLSGGFLFGTGTYAVYLLNGPMNIFGIFMRGGESFGCGEFHLTVFRCSDKQLPFVSILPEFSGRPCGGITACFIRKVSFLIFSILRRL